MPESGSRAERWLSRFRRKRSVIERRLRVCNMGSIFPGEETEWSRDPENPEAVKFREKYSDLACLDHCPVPSHEWEIHQRHLITEERVVDA